MGRRMLISLTAKTWLAIWLVTFVGTVMVVNVKYTMELDITGSNSDHNHPRKSQPSPKEREKDTVPTSSRNSDRANVIPRRPRQDTRVFVQENAVVLKEEERTDFKKVETISRLDLKLWPDESNQDRIVDQLKYRYHTPNSTKIPISPNNTEDLKVILLAAYKSSSYGAVKLGRQQFLKDQCGVDTCFLSSDEGLARKATAQVHRFLSKKIGPKPEGQIWIWYQLESPYHSGNVPSSPKLAKTMNWTATYRRDSTLVAPYEKFAHFENFTKLPAKPRRNYALGKTKMAAWFVTNCRDKNGRLNYARELQKHVDVDIYGNCGTLKCPRYKAKECFDMLNKDYKFYLAFENSNCQDYITEKFYWNALFNDIVPIVMGARPEDYASVAPPHSYIHVDDFESPQALAEHLHWLDRNDTAYNEYFLWKGTGEFINTKFWCRLCAMLHVQNEDKKVTWYEDLHEWWAGPNVCKGPSKRGWASWIDLNETASSR